VRAAPAAALVGNYPNLRGDVFPLSDENLNFVETEFGIEVDRENYDYYIEYRA
jgi:hypothetical protein